MKVSFIPASHPGKLELLLPHLKQFGGHPMAFSTLQPGLEYVLADSVGYVAGMRFEHPVLARKHVFLVLSHPVADGRDWPVMLRALLAHHPRCVFIQIGRYLASMLDALGFKVFQLGVESDLGIQDFDLKGNGRAKLRQWRNKCEREGVEVREEPLEAQDMDEVRRVSREWLEHRGNEEKGFLTRPFRMDGEPGMRYFWARQHGKLIGFSAMDPLYRDGRVAGYYHNFDRLASEAPNGTSVYTVLKAMESYRREGLETLALGLSPLTGMDDDFNKNQLLQKLSSLIYEHGNSLYPFKGNASHKKKYAPVHTKSYVAGNVNIVQIALAAGAVCGLKLGNGTSPTHERT